MRIAACAFLLPLAVAASCSSTATKPEPITLPDSGRTYFPGDQWRTLAPRGAGFDENRLSSLRSDMARGKYGTLHGVLIVRYGFLVFEQYENWSRDQLHTMQSVTKSVTSLLLGI